MRYLNLLISLLALITISAQAESDAAQELNYKQVIDYQYIGDKAMESADVVNAAARLLDESNYFAAAVKLKDLPLEAYGGVSSNGQTRPVYTPIHSQNLAKLKEKLQAMSRVIFANLSKVQQAELFGYHGFLPMVTLMHPFMISDAYNMVDLANCFTALDGELEQPMLVLSISCRSVETDLKRFFRVQTERATDEQKFVAAAFLEGALTAGLHNIGQAYARNGREDDQEHYVGLLIRNMTEAEEAWQNVSEQRRLGISFIRKHKIAEQFKYMGNYSRRAQELEAALLSAKQEGASKRAQLDITLQMSEAISEEYFYNETIEMVPKFIAAMASLKELASEVDLTAQERGELFISTQHMRATMGQLDERELADANIYAHSIYPDTNYLYSAAAYFYRLKDYEMASEYATRAFAELGEEFYVADLMALVLARDGRKDEAFAILEVSIDRIEAEIEALASHQDPKWLQSEIRALERTRAEISEDSFGVEEEQ